MKTDLKRYDIIGGTGYNEGLTFENEDECGEWVKYEDAKEMLDCLIQAKEDLIYYMTEVGTSLGLSKESAQRIANEHGTIIEINHIIQRL